MIEYLEKILIREPYRNKVKRFFKNIGIGLACLIGLIIGEEDEAIHGTQRKKAFGSTEKSITKNFPHRTKKVLFVYPDINVKGGALSYHFGLGSLSAVLKNAGCDTSLAYLDGSYNIKPLIKKINEFKPDLIGITTVSSQYKYVKRILKDIKKYNIFTICGGPHISLAPWELEKTEGLDAICIGEGEYPLLELVQKLQEGSDITDIKNIWIKKDGKIFRNPCRPLIENLDELPFGDRDLFDFSHIINSDYDRALFMSSKGCPYSCTYCSNSGLRNIQEGRYVRFRSIENVIREIKEVISKYEVKSIYINDDVFTINKNYVRQFCKSYKDEIGYPFEINARVEDLNGEVLSALKNAGCYRIAMGIEQGNEEFRKRVLNRSMSNQKIEETFRLAKEMGIKTKTFNIVGFPFETFDIHMDTVKLNRRIEPSSLVIYVFEPYAGTPIYDECIRNRFISPERESMEFVSRTDTILDMPMFPRRQILNCYRNFAWRVYKGKSMQKAFLYKVYYSKYGESLIRILSPFKKAILRLAAK